MPMTRVLFLGFLTIGFLGAQTLRQDVTPKLEPYQERALQNALRPPLGSPTAQFLPPYLYLPSTPQSGTIQTGSACAIPLTPIAVDPNLDPGIQHKVQSPASMPEFKSMPVCGENR